MKFPSPPGSISFPENERAVMKRWEERRTFQRSIEQRSRTKNYSFYDGPPFATGLPHYGHLLVSTIKDVIPRYWTMRGYRVERRFGWDCHGLPIEFEERDTILLCRIDCLARASSSSVIPSLSNNFSSSSMALTTLGEFSGLEIA